MKTLVIGCGGIGSWLFEELCHCIKQGQIDMFKMHITLADSDIVELNQLKYQNFKADEAGMNKAKALAKRFSEYGAEALKQRITNERYLKGYDLIVLCVDNAKTRDLVIKFCHSSDKQFFDIRSTGRRIFAMPKTSLKDNIRFVDANDRIEYSCQEKDDLEKGMIQKGNKIAAMIACQMILNFIRGHSNRTILLEV